MESLRARLGTTFAGELIGPDDPVYDAARAVWNAMIDNRPALIARCRTTGDVAAAVVAAQDDGAELAVRCGGHSVAGHSVCDGGLVIDLGAMRGVDVDAERRLASVQGGALLGDLDRATQAHGLAAPAGVVSHTGVGGLTLGGGFGWLSRLYGLTCDNVVAAEVVTAAGEVVVAGEDGDEELLWALRGGGGNFGVVTRFDLRLHPLAGPIWQATFAYAADDAEEALVAFADLAAGGPRELTLAAWIGAARASPFLPEQWRGRPVVMLSAVYVGDEAAGERLVAPLRAAGPFAEVAAETSYLDLQRSADESAAPGFRRCWKAHFLSTLDSAAVATFLEQGIRAADESSNAGCELFALGGAAADAAPGATAFAHRAAQWDFMASARWSDPADDSAELAVARNAAAAMAPFARGVYANDLMDEGSDRVRAAYGDETYGRLVGVKDRVDPGNVFHRNQNIPPSSSPVP